MAYSTFLYLYVLLLLFLGENPRSGVTGSKGLCILNVN